MVGGVVFSYSWCSITDLDLPASIGGVGQFDFRRGESGPVKSRVWVRCRGRLASLFFDTMLVDTLTGDDPIACSWYVIT